MNGIGQPGSLARAVDLVAATGFAASSAYAALAVTGQAEWSVAAGAAGFAATLALMNRIDDSPRFTMADFATPSFDASVLSELPELLLTELTELLLTETVGDDDALLLDDQLVAPGENSRVIRLFDPRTFPTAGELHDRIEGHLNGDRSYPDATAELHQALSDLRSALR